MITDSDDEVIAELIELDAVTTAVPPIVSAEAKQEFERRRKAREAPELARAIVAALAFRGATEPNVQVKNGGVEISCPFGCSVYDVPNAVRISPPTTWRIEGNGEEAVSGYLAHLRGAHGAGWAP